MVDISVLVAIIGSFSAIAGSLVTTLANHLNEKAKFENNERARYREERQKWLNGQREAYTKFILNYSIPFSSANIQDHWRNLIKAATEAYLYGNLYPAMPFTIHDPSSLVTDVLSEIELREILKESVEEFAELQVNYRLLKGAASHFIANTCITVM